PKPGCQGKRGARFYSEPYAKTERAPKDGALSLPWVMTGSCQYRHRFGDLSRRQQEIALRPARPRQLHIQRGEADLEPLGQCDVPGVVCGNVVAQLPDTLGDCGVGKEVDPQQLQIGMRQGCDVLRNLSRGSR